MRTRGVMNSKHKSSLKTTQTIVVFKNDLPHTIVFPFAEDHQSKNNNLFKTCILRMLKWCCRNGNLWKLSTVISTSLFHHYFTLFNETWCGYARSWQCLALDYNLNGRETFRTVKNTKTTINSKLKFCFSHSKKPNI